MELDAKENLTGVPVNVVNSSPSLPRTSVSDAAANTVTGRPAGSAESAALQELRRSLLEPIWGREEMDIEASAAQVRATSSLGDISLTVLTAGAESATEIDIKLDEVWLEMQKELAGLSSNSTHIVVPNATHCIQCDAPEAVADAILNVLNATR